MTKQAAALETPISVFLAADGRRAQEAADLAERGPEAFPD